MGLIQLLQGDWNGDITVQRLNTQTCEQVFRILYIKLLEVAEHCSNSAATVRVGGIPQEIDNNGCENRLARTSYADQRKSTYPRERLEDRLKYAGAAQCVLRPSEPIEEISRLSNPLSCISLTPCEDILLGLEEVQRREPMKNL